jgi:hypothetical protein
MRKFALAVTVLLVGFSVAMAADFGLTITKVDGSKITGNKKGEKVDGKLVKGAEVTLEVLDKAKVNMGTITFKDKNVSVEVGDKIEGGLKASVFTKLPEKGLQIRVTTNDDGKVTDIVVVKGKKKAN